MSMFNDISCDRKGNKDECLANARVVKVLAIWYRTMGIYWSRFRKEVVFYGREQPTRNLGSYRGKELVEFAESGCPIFRATTPLSSCKLKSKGHGKLSIHYCADQATIETIFSHNCFCNQLSLYGAVANMCEECESFTIDQCNLIWRWDNQIVLSVIKIEVSLENDDPAHQNLL